MDKVAGYAGLVARIRVAEEQTKPFLRKPYLRYSQCPMLWAYCFQLGGALATKHKANLDAFIHAFLGMHGEAGAAKRACTNIANSIMERTEVSSMTPLDFVMTNFVGRINHNGNAFDYFVEHERDKLPSKTAIILSWQFASDGCALGAIFPKIVREMYLRLYTDRGDKEDWERARDAGLDIPAWEDRVTFEEFREEEDERFMAFHRQHQPDLYSMLEHRKRHFYG